MARGNPIIAIRLEAPTIAALKIAARRHETTVSEFIRQLIEEQLQRDGIKKTVQPIDGQISI